MSLLDRLLTPSIIMPDGSYHKPLSPSQVKELEEGKRLEKETLFGIPHSKTSFKSEAINGFCDECVQNGWMTLEHSKSARDYFNSITVGGQARTRTTLPAPHLYPRSAPGAPRAHTRWGSVQQICSNR